ncbi:lysophospholipid acyltransferase family protein [Rheinheimera sp. 4Y26]|uniref:lysophospholipid acyltransferase family protein n=1 Tax=Rheinheimera sp. 4Y26 TaxID=2977811 RepID=UPI0021B11AC6|nr:lysophospholipid acyltransferase family protein [Rheinheimera sp. 4Y26]MCT6698234.1 1-acyl-sn-glycerol-3-phosphate acyltransferase [Rheinheimera sp. 4Y26]
MWQKLNHLYRILATGFCFSVFGLGGLVLSLLVFPVQRLLIPDQHKRRQVARYTVHRSFRFFIGLMRGLGVFNFDFPAKAELEQSKGKILIANHPSLIDVVALISMLPQADCVVKAQLFRNPFMRGVIQSTGYLTNADPDLLLHDCAASLKSGNTLIIFPEGTRTTPGLAQHFQRGAANIALRSGCNFFACFIQCKPSTLTKDEAWYQVPAQKPTLKIRVLREIDIQPFLQLESASLAARQLSRELETFYHQVMTTHGTTENRT